MNMIAIVLELLVVLGTVNSSGGRLDLLDHTRVASHSPLDVNMRENVGSKRVTVGDFATLIT